jgi:hypothetical protein
MSRLLFGGDKKLRRGHVFLFSRGRGRAQWNNILYIYESVLEIVPGDKLLLNAQFSIHYNKFYIGIKTTHLGLQNGLKNNNWNTFD